MNTSILLGKWKVRKGSEREEKSRSEGRGRSHYSMFTFVQNKEKSFFFFKRVGRYNCLISCIRNLLGCLKHVLD